MSLLFNTRCSNRHLNKWKDMNLFVDIFNALRRFKLWNFSLECPFLNETLRLITTVATVKSILLSFPGISLSSFENYNCDHEFFMFSLVLRRRILITSVFRVGVFTLKTHQMCTLPRRNLKTQQSSVSWICVWGNVTSSFSNVFRPH